MLCSPSSRLLMCASIGWILSGMRNNCRPHLQVWSIAWGITGGRHLTSTQEILPLFCYSAEPDLDHGVCRQGLTAYGLRATVSLWIISCFTLQPHSLTDSLHVWWTWHRWTSVVGPKLFLCIPQSFSFPSAEQRENLQIPSSWKSFFYHQTLATIKTLISTEIFLCLLPSPIYLVFLIKLLSLDWGHRAVLSPGGRMSITVLLLCDTPSDRPPASFLIWMVIPISATR